MNSNTYDWSTLTQGVRKPGPINRLEEHWFSDQVEVSFAKEWGTFISHLDEDRRQGRPPVLTTAHSGFSDPVQAGLAALARSAIEARLHSHIAHQMAVMEQVLNERVERLVEERVERALTERELARVARVESLHPAHITSEEEFVRSRGLENALTNLREAAASVFGGSLQHFTQQVERDDETGDEYLAVVVAIDTPDEDFLGFRRAFFNAFQEKISPAELSNLVISVEFA
ncbi:MAG TPA: hypothetical protein VF263_08700 [Longimicrobiaceae bacterium]